MVQVPDEDYRKFSGARRLRQSKYIALGRIYTFAPNQYRKFEWRKAVEMVQVPDEDYRKFSDARRLRQCKYVALGRIYKFAPTSIVNLRAQGGWDGTSTRRELS